MGFREAWTRVALADLRRAGVRHAVVSPGSRSTPLVIAAEQAGLELHSVIDEREAGFIALGIGKAAGTPALLLCTSGTAGAHYLPAIIEARHAGTPLLAMTADRPRELHASGANQTMDQSGLFGSYVLRRAELSPTEPSRRALLAVRRSVAQLAAAAMGPPAGPVHFNVQLRKPLEPQPDDAFQSEAQAIVDTPVPEVTAPLRPALPPSLIEAVATAKRGILVCGPGEMGPVDRAPVLELARRHGWMLLAEATSDYRFWARPGIPTIDAVDTVFRSEAARSLLRPDLVIQLGLTPVSKGYEQFIERSTVPRAVVHAGPWADPAGTARWRIVSRAAEFASAALATIDGPAHEAVDGGARVIGSPKDWPSLIAALETTFLEPTGATLSEAGVASEVVRALSSRGKGNLVIGNSLIPRTFDVHGVGGGSLHVLHQRGVSGIDGLLSSAAGAALATGRPTLLIVGDVSFLHGASGLLFAGTVNTPLAIVVVNNQGGRIFEQLPIADQRSESERSLWTTPHQVDLGGLSRSYGVGYRRVMSVPELAAALAAALDTSGCSVVEATVPPHDAASDADAFRSAFETTLARGRASSRGAGS
ncbi:MAG: 2-succinyl-5-enolpyruvyl-6-hydroxy-3-cyclohexene-1-carboxylic-acid synthase [Myxococcota bacterium]